MAFEYFASIVPISGHNAKSRYDTSKMSFVPYGFLEGGKPVEGYFKKITKLILRQNYLLLPSMQGCIQLKKANCYSCRKIFKAKYCPYRLTPFFFG